MAHEMPSFFMGTVKDDDSAELKEQLGMANKETQELIALGFIKDISESAVEVLETVSRQAGRPVRLYHITKLGRDFFKASVSPFLN